MTVLPLSKSIAAKEESVTRILAQERRESVENDPKSQTEKPVIFDGEKVETGEVIISEDGKLLTYKGQEYGRLCGEFVAEYSTSEKTYCVLVVDHKKRHRDKHGRESGEYR